MAGWGEARGPGGYGSGGPVAPSPLPPVIPPGQRGESATAPSPVPAALNLLTEAEHEVVRYLQEAWNAYAMLNWDGHRAAKEGDLGEFTAAIHVCENAVLARAASRAYPDRYRL